MCKNVKEQAKAKKTIREMAGQTAKILAVYENIDGKPDLVGFFAAYEKSCDANLFEVHSGGKVNVMGYIPNYTGMGRRRIALLFGPMSKAIPC